jgi:hypothetical protein
MCPVMFAAHFNQARMLRQLLNLGGKVDPIDHTGRAAQVDPSLKAVLFSAFETYFV